MCFVYTDLLYVFDKLRLQGALSHFFVDFEADVVKLLNLTITRTCLGPAVPLLLLVELVMSWVTSNTNQ